MSFKLLILLVSASCTESTAQVSAPEERENKIEDIHLRFYNGSTFSEYADVRLGNALDLLRANGFVTSRPTVLYVHGFIETALQESVQIYRMQEMASNSFFLLHVMVSAYLQGRPDTNVILLDWANMANGSYVLNAAPNTKKVGIAVAEQLKRLLDNGIPLEKLHVIGHSLGGQVAGYIARELKTNYGTTLKRVTALDPAFPLFYPDGLVMEHITASDADFVDVIHTDAGGNGAPVRTGTVDFWPNGGKSTQPGCPRFAPIPLSDDSFCSHWRSWRFFAESVLKPDAFPASPAESHHKFKNNPNPEQGMVYMGIDCDASASGSYYLITNSASPFGKGTDGLYV